jgi:cytochrome P450
MRDSQPVWYEPESNAWNVYRYDDVAAILADYRTFSSDFARLFPDRADLTEGSIVAMDPPRHDQLRSLVSQAFTPRTIARLADRIEGLTEELLDQLDGAQHMELVADLAYPLPVTVIAELLGIPSSDRAQFKLWADALLSRSGGNPRARETLEAARSEIKHFHDYLHEHVSERRVRPRQDLLTDLVEAEIDGQRLGDAEIVGFATILLLAGHITTTLLLGNTLLCIDEYPAAQSALRVSPESIPGALEEVLRFRSPVPFTARVTTTDVQLRAQHIEAGQLVYAWLQSANQDERRFDGPELFNIDRQPNPHVAFGKGIHFCLGAPLARLESKIAIGVLLKRYSEIRVDRGQPIETYERFNGVRALHLEVSAAPSGPVAARAR